MTGAVRGFVRTRSADRDYGFLGAEPERPWWWERGEYPALLHVDDYLSGVAVRAADGTWGAYVGGVPSRRRDHGSGTTIRYDLVLAPAGEGPPGRETADRVGALVCHWLAALGRHAPESPESFLSRLLDALFPDPGEIPGLLSRRDEESAEEVDRRLQKLLDDCLAGHEPASADDPLPGSWVGGSEDPTNARAFAAHVRELLTGGCEGRALLGNLIWEPGDAPAPAPGERLAVLIRGRSDPATELSPTEPEGDPEPDQRAGAEPREKVRGRSALLLAPALLMVGLLLAAVFTLIR